MIFRLELVTVPVSDVDRAKDFYVDRVGFSAEQDRQVDAAHRFVELMPPARRARSPSPPATSTPSPARSRASSSTSTTQTRPTPSCATAASTSPTSKSSHGAASASSQIPTATAGRSTGQREELPAAEAVAASDGVRLHRAIADS